MSTFEDAWYKTESDIQSVFSLFNEPKQNANVGDFDINNPEKEVGEYEGAFKAWKKAKKAQMKAANNYHDAAKEYNRLSLEYSEAENAGDMAKCKVLLSEIQDAALEVEETEKALNDAEIEVSKAEKAMEKERTEAAKAADKAKAGGDNSFSERVEAHDALKNEFAELSDKELSDKIKEAKSLIAEADRNLKHSLEKMESQLSNTGHQLMNGANAAMDPNGNGGVKVAEAAVMGMLALSKSALSAAKSIRASILRRGATKNAETLTSVLEERHAPKESDELPTAEGPELD